MQRGRLKAASQGFAEKRQKTNIDRIYMINRIIIPVHVHVHVYVNENHTRMRIP